MAVRSLMVLLVPPMGVAMPLNPAGSMLLASSFSAAARESMVSGTGVKDCVQYRGEGDEPSLCQMLRSHGVGEGVTKESP